MGSLIVEDLVKLILRLLILLTTWSAIDGADGVIWLALARWIPLVAKPTTVIIALPIVVAVTSREAAALLFLFVCPALHHVAQFHYCFGVIMPKVTVDGLDSNATLKVVDDVVVRNVGDCGSCVEEALDVGSNGFTVFLLDTM